MGASSGDAEPSDEREPSGDAEPSGNVGASGDAAFRAAGSTPWPWVPLLVPLRAEVTGRRLAADRTQRPPIDHLDRSPACVVLGP